MLSQTYSSLDPQLLLTKPGVLAVISFTESCAEPAMPGLIPIGTESLSMQPYEVIRYGDKIAERGTGKGCQWSRIDDLLCVATWLSAAACADIEESTRDAYSRLFGVIQAAGFAQPFRIWNFIPHINEGRGDREQYKRFCVGRQQAFDQLHVAHRQYPAASALGHQGENLVIYMLAGRQAGEHYENPRQDPAYRYPRQYGPCSPSFARATGFTLDRHRQVFISGTASILGHDTTAAGDLEQQIAVTLENIQYLLDSIPGNVEALEAIRVYLRHPRDYSAARALLLQRFPAEALNFLHADICRDNLLIEIEAAARASSGPC